MKLSLKEQMNLIRGLALCETALMLRPVDNEVADLVQKNLKDLSDMLLERKEP